jgi:flagellar hook-associated protein 1 FlgK
MRSSFFEFNVAATGLFAARGGLEITGHNIANAATPGYSRQRPERRATWPLTYYDGRGMVGTGTEIYGIDRTRDRFMDMRYWNDNATLGEYGAKSMRMDVLERQFREMSGAGTIAGFDKFFQTLQDLSTTAGDDVYRSGVLRTADNLSDFINNLAQDLKKHQRDINAEVEIVTRRIHGLGAQIASLNGQIARYELDGSKANDLRDARERLLDELSIYVNTDTFENEIKGVKEFEVTINGYELVKGEFARGLDVIARDRPLALEPNSGAKRNPWDADGLFDVFFDDGSKMDIYSPTLKGQLKGLIDVRDGNNALYLRGAVSDAESGGGTLVVYADADARIDVARFGAADNQRGVLSVYNATGVPVDLTYNACSFDPATNRYEFGVISPIPALAVNSPATVGKTTSYKGAPHYMDKLNELTRTFAKAVNEGLDRKNQPIPGVTGHVNGFDANGENHANPFFTSGSVLVGDYSDMAGENFSVNPQLSADPALVAAAAKGVDGISANQIILEFLELKHFDGMFSEGKIADYVISVAAELGTDVRQANNFNEYYGEMAAETDNLRKSVSGVDTNEEMVSLVKYQQLYQAASQMINVIDRIYEITINNLGVT